MSFHFDGQKRDWATTPALKGQNGQPFSLFCDKLERETRFSRSSPKNSI